MAKNTFMPITNEDPVAAAEISSVTNPREQPPAQPPLAEEQDATATDSEAQSETRPIEVITDEFLALKEKEEESHIGITTKKVRNITNSKSPCPSTIIMKASKYVQKQKMRPTTAKAIPTTY